MLLNQPEGKALRCYELRCRSCWIDINILDYLSALVTCPTQTYSFPHLVCWDLVTHLSHLSSSIFSVHCSIPLVSSLPGSTTAFPFLLDISFIQLKINDVKRYIKEMQMNKNEKKKKKLVWGHGWWRWFYSLKHLNQTLFSPTLAKSSCPLFHDIGLIFKSPFTPFLSLSAAGDCAADRWRWISVIRFIWHPSHGRVVEI